MAKCWWSKIVLPVLLRLLWLLGLSWVVLPARLGHSLPESPPPLAAGASWVFLVGGLSGTAVSFGIRQFSTLSDLPSALKKGWSPGAVKIRKEKKKFIVLGNNCCLVTHIACYMKMKILIELTWTFSMEVSVFMKLLIIPPSSRVD